MLDVRVEAIEEAAQDIRLFMLRPCGPDSLPGYSAGAHIDVHLRSGRVRQYSLCGNLGDPRAYGIAVQREPQGRGGSLEIFDEWKRGTQVRISGPRNKFQLVEGAQRSLLIAGGIGITPIVAMADQLRSSGQPFHLYFSTRNAVRTPFRDRITPLEAAGVATLRHDDGMPERQFDLQAMLSVHQCGTHLYYCGPSGMMQAVARASAHWPKGTVHCEHFGREGMPQNAERPVEFRIRLRSRGVELAVPPGASIAQVLRSHGVEVETSCESGLCGACRTRYTGGVPDHQDLILDEDERRDFVMVCCARAKSEVLELDL